MKRGTFSTSIGLRGLLGCVVGVCVLLSGCSDTHTIRSVTHRAASGSSSADDDGSVLQQAGTDAAARRADASVKRVADASAKDAAPMMIDSGVDCSGVAEGELPNDLACTGLYANLASKTVASGVRAFRPAHQLWSDGAAKLRWILIPKGTQIDSSDPNEWHFPVGTKLFKEFSWNGHRVETRMFWKAAEGRWLKAPYHWNDDETMATRFAGGMVDVAGDAYYIPAAKDCDQCHKGRDDRALGFEQISLGLDGATGLTLSELVSQKLLSNAPTATQLTIGDDGTGKAADALGWMHVNCGVSCHSSNSNADAYKTNMFLRLSADQVDGSSSAGFDPIKTTVGVASTTPRWLGQQRIAAGSPENSLLYTLINHRDPANQKDQMPPIASRVVDSEGVPLIEAWIRSLPAQ